MRALDQVVSRDTYAMSKKAKHGWVFNSNTKKTKSEFGVRRLNADTRREALDAKPEPYGHRMEE